MDGVTRPGRVLFYAVTAARWGLGLVFGTLLVIPLACGGRVNVDDSADDNARDDGDQGNGARGGGGRPGRGDPPENSCVTASDCGLIPDGCCAGCGAQGIEDVVAVPMDGAVAWKPWVCDEPNPSCPECEGALNPRLYADCVEGACEAVDLGALDDECRADTDCVAIPTACCECGASTDPSTIVSIPRDRMESFIEYQCGNDGIFCDACLWSPPEGLRAFCDGGQCFFDFEG
jgi:hypothetical protein